MYNFVMGDMLLIILFETSEVGKNVQNSKKSVN